MRWDGVRIAHVLGEWALLYIVAAAPCTAAGTPRLAVLKGYRYV